MSRARIGHAVACGVRRGRTEFANSLRNVGDVGYYVVGTLVAVTVLYLNRDTPVEGAGITVAVLIFPGLLAMVASFSALLGLATAVSTEREDGTLLRCKALPHGLQGYVAGQVTRSLLEATFSLVVLCVPATILLPGLWSAGALEVVRMGVVLLLGLTACVALGLTIGSLFKNPRSVGGWGFLLLGGLILVSGLFQPLSTMPGWAQAVGQLFPLYWMGLGMRAGILPEEAVMIEIGQSWRVWQTFAVLTAWAVVGMVLAPVLLRRMARRESGSGVAARRQAAMQRV
jgi:ABC-2 type transport system permease protein